MRSSDSRRAFLRGIVAVGGLTISGVLLQACGGSTTAPSTGSSAAPAPTPAPPAAQATVPAAKPTAPAAAPPATAPAASNPAATSGSGFDWMKYKGSTVSFMVDAHDFTNDVVPKILPAFEKLTGIKVTWQVFPENQFRQKLTLALQSNPQSVDGYMSLTSWDGKSFAKAGWYEPIKPFVTSKELTAPDYDFADFFPNTVQIATVDGTLIGVPMYPEVQMLYYNQPALEKAALKPPETFDDLVAAAKKLTDKSNNTYGFVTRGDGAQLPYTLAPFIFGFGGQWLNANGEPDFTSDGFVKGVETYALLMREYGPPGAAGIQWPQENVLFDQEHAMMTTDSSNFVSTYEDPKKSKLSGKTGYTHVPKGPNGIRSTLISWALSLNAKGTKKNAAWYLLQTLTNKQTVQAAAAQKIPVARQSVYDSSVVQSGFPKAWLETYKMELPTAEVNQANPLVVPVPETRDVIGKMVDAVINGADAKQAAAKAQDEVVKILKSVH